MCEKCRAAWAAAAKKSSAKASKQRAAAKKKHKKAGAHPAKPKGEHKGSVTPGAKAKTPTTTPETTGAAGAGGPETVNHPGYGEGAQGAPRESETETTSTPSGASESSSSASSSSGAQESTPPSERTQTASEPAADEAPQKREEEEKPRKRAFDVDRAVSTLNANANEKSEGHCAKFVREAIESGGTTVPNRPLYAKDYGSRLVQMGLEEVSPEGYVPQKGDVVVFEPPSGETAGHIQMWNGSRWVSDFRQRADDIYPGPAYRKQKVSYAIYRP